MNDTVVKLQDKELAIAQFQANIQHSGLYIAYTQAVKDLSVYPKGVVYPTLGLAGEFGEFLTNKHDMKEAGDICWYVAALTVVYELSPAQVFQEPISPSHSDWTAMIHVFTICEITKKVYRDRFGIPSDVDKKRVLPHLQEIVSYLKGEISCLFEDVLRENVEKLYSRKFRDVLQGDGDNR